MTDKPINKSRYLPLFARPRLRSLRDAVLPPVTLLKAVLSGSWCTVGPAISPPGHPQLGGQLPADTVSKLGPDLKSP